MILVDSNILIYAAGSEHPCKRPSVEFLLAAACGEVEAAVDAEVLPEILRRYRAIGRWAQGKAVYDQARRIFPLVISIDAEILDRARKILDENVDLMARDALHAAVAQVRALDAICSFDGNFDSLRGFRRIEPQSVN